MNNYRFKCKYLFLGLLERKYNFITVRLAQYKLPKDKRCLYKVIKIREQVLT